MNLLSCYTILRVFAQNFEVRGPDPPEYFIRLSPLQAFPYQWLQNPELKDEQMSLQPCDKICIFLSLVVYC